jgi:CheY-like chemotaxis protein
MRSLIEWLARVEGMAERFYAEAAGRFREDPALESFLRRLTEEENWHRGLMEKALEAGRAGGLPASEIVLDDALRSRIEGMLRDAASAVEKGTCTSVELLAAIVASEYSEWNDVFLYVMNSLQGVHREFGAAASMIQQHKAHLVRYLETVPEGSVHLEAIGRLRDLWKERILVVDDDATLRMLFTDLLSSLGEVETADGGAQALDKVASGHYDVVLSDLTMPVMDGMQFFMKAVQIDPSLRQRFLFFSGNPAERHLAFFREHDLTYLIKPVSIAELEEAVAAILERRRKFPA